VSAPELLTRLLERCDYPGPGAAVTCAVSGGADSLALLVLAATHGCAVTAVHVDHGLRPGSAAEAEVVAAAAERFGAAFRAERVRVPAGPGLEARARAARYAVLPVGVLTGHTADDQAETVVANLLRGGGLDGLAGMRRDPDRVRRPLLALRRTETEAVCAAVGLRPVRDPSNLDPAFTRNRIRHEVLPLLDAVAGRDVTAVLARQAPLLADEAAFLDDLASGVDPTDARALVAQPVVLARRAVRRWLRAEHPPSSAEVERVLAVARGEAVACEIGGGRRVVRRAGRLRVEPVRSPE
jgi:tRNA(Ile)-lysidine synthase